MAIIHVRRTGSDSNTGTLLLPVLTITRALSLASSYPGSTIYLHEELYSLGNNIVEVPSQTKIIGLGKDTKINGALKLLSGVELRNLTFTCDNYVHDIGITVLDTTEVLIENVKLYGYRVNALFIDNLINCTFSNLQITDSSYNDNKTGKPGFVHTQAILCGKLTNCLLTRINIDTRARGGGGVGTSGRSAKSNGLVGLVSTVFDRFDITTDKWHSWGSGTTPQMSIEFHGNEYAGVAVTNGYYRSTFSLNSFQYVGVNNCILVKGNTFDGSMWGSYAFELGARNLDMCENIIRNSPYPMSNWGGSWYNMNIHNNLFYKTRSTNCLSLEHTQTELKFKNNTIYYETAQNNFEFRQSFTGADISKNIFFTLSDVSVDTPVPNFTDNLLFGYSSPNAGNITNVNPNFVSASQATFAEFVPTNASASGYGAVNLDGTFTQ